MNLSCCLRSTLAWQMSRCPQLRQVSSGTALLMKRKKRLPWRHWKREEPKVVVKDPIPLAIEFLHRTGHTETTELIGNNEILVSDSGLVGIKRDTANTVADGDEPDVEKVTGDLSLAELGKIKQILEVKTLSLKNKATESEENRTSENLKRTLEDIEWDLKALKFKEIMLERKLEVSETAKYDRMSVQNMDHDLVNKQNKTPKRGTQEGCYLWGTADPSIPISDITCGGCGAKLHCQDRAIPGYVPSERYKSCDSEELKSLVCHRCHLMTAQNYIADVTVNEDEFENVIKQIRNDRALVIVIVDVMDMWNSVLKGFVSKIGKTRPIYVLGNKIDLIPKDDKGYLERVKIELMHCCEEAGLNPNGNNIRHMALVSGKTGYGIEKLITKLMTDWQLRGNVYLVGTANCGKSTLFNTLLGSDYCKTNVRELIKRATISRWPGTTLSFLKFPIVNPAPWRLERRRMQLSKFRIEDEQADEIRKQRLLRGGRSKNFILRGAVNITDMRKEEDMDEGPPSIAHWSTMELKDDCIQRQEVTTKKTITKPTTAIDENMFPQSKWLLDTPGLVKENQIISHLTADELRVVLHDKIIRPRVFVLKPGQTMFVSGLSRLDYLEGGIPSFFTVHTAPFVPVHVVETDVADEFYDNNICTEKLGVPLGGKERLEHLSPLVGQEFQFTSEDKNIATADIQLSSLGWVSVNSRRGVEMVIKAYTPGGVGMYLRMPALLPNFKSFRGFRIKKDLQKTPEYHLRRLRP